MAAPKKRHTKATRNKRRAHLALSGPALSVDKQTKSVHRPHHIDLKTGFYRGKQVLFNDEEPADEAAADDQNDS